MSTARQMCIRDRFKTVPSEDVDPEAHNDDEPYWFYANSNGELAAGEIKTLSLIHI